MPKTSLPAAVVVSMAAPCPVSTFSRCHAPGQVVHGVDQDGAGRVRADPVSTRPACPSSQAPSGSSPSRAILALAGRLVLVKMRRDRPGGDQRIALQIGGLGAVRLRYPHVANQHLFTCHIYVRLCDSVRRKVQAVKICHLTRHSV